MTEPSVQPVVGTPLRGHARSNGSDRPAAARPGVVVALAVVAFLFAGGLVLALRSARGGTDGDLVLAASNLEFSARVLDGRSGEVRLTFANTDAVTHTVTIPPLGVDLVVGSGEAGTATFRADPGTYRFVCTVPGHDGPGMRGELRLR